jgi:hypothetical protein
MTLGGGLQDLGGQPRACLSENIGEGVTNNGAQLVFLHNMVMILCDNSQIVALHWQRSDHEPQLAVPDTLCHSGTQDIKLCKQDAYGSSWTAVLCAVEPLSMAGENLQMNAGADVPGPSWGRA